MLGKEQTVIQRSPVSYQFVELLVKGESRMILPQSQQGKQGPRLLDSTVLADAQEHNSVKNPLNAFIQGVAVNDAPVLWMFGDILCKLHPPIGKIVEERFIKKEFTGLFLKIFLLECFDRTPQDRFTGKRIVQFVEFVEIGLPGEVKFLQRSDFRFIVEGPFGAVKNTQFFEICEDGNWNAGGEAVPLDLENGIQAGHQIDRWLFGFHKELRGSAYSETIVGFLTRNPLLGFVFVICDIFQEGGVLLLLLFDGGVRREKLFLIHVHFAGEASYPAFGENLDLVRREHLFVADVPSKHFKEGIDQKLAGFGFVLGGSFELIDILLEMQDKLFEICSGFGTRFSQSVYPPLEM